MVISVRSRTAPTPGQGIGPGDEITSVGTGRMSDNDRYSGMKYAGLGLELVGAVVGLTLLGWWIDGRYGSAPWGLLIGLGIGLIGGLYNLLRQVISETKRAERDAERKRTSPPRDSDPRP